MRQCSTQFLDSNKEDSENIFSCGIVSHNSNNSTLHNSRIIAFEFLLHGLYEVLYDEDDFRSFLLALELGDVLLLLQLRVTVLAL